MTICLASLAVLHVFDTPVGLVGRAQGATLYVNTSGSGGAYTSIQDAINASSSNDTVYVYNGTYFENIVINKTINFTGQDMSNTIIDGGNSGDVIYINASWVNVSGFTVKNSGYQWTPEYDSGIKLENVGNCSIINNNITDNKIGIRLSNFNDSLISNNIFFSNYREGVNMDNSNRNNITDNNFMDHSEGILTDESNGNNIINNSFTQGGWMAIHLFHSAGSNIINNYVTDYSGGVYLEYASTTTLSSNTFVKCGLSFRGSNIDHWNTHDIGISNTVNGKPVYYYKNLSVITAPQDAGQIIFANCFDVTIEDQIINSSYSGIYIGYCSNGNITNNNISNNTYGIRICDSNGFNISENTISNTFSGVSFDKSDNNIIFGNKITDSDYGIFLIFVKGNIVLSNLLSENYEGIHISNSDENLVLNNTISGFEEGIQIFASNSQYLKNNTMKDVGVLISSPYIEDWNTHDIDFSNTVNGKPVYYIKNQSSALIPTDISQLILANCSDMIVKDLIINNTSDGIQIGFSSNITLTNNTISNGRHGIYIQYSDFNNITNNYVQKNRWGILLYTANDNNLINNTFYDNIQEGIFIRYSSSRNNISYNYVKENSAGISLASSDNNTIMRNIINSLTIGVKLSRSDGNHVIANTIESHWHRGLELSYGSCNNTIHHNSFLKNGDHVYIDGESLNNSWDDGMGEGNYWDDYTGVDNGSGGRIAGDGVGDTEIPHPFIDQGNGYFQLDNYPLMEPYHDIYPPEIQLNFPSNNSIFRPGIVLDFNVSDSNLDSVKYTVDSEPEEDFIFPYDIPTSDWMDGSHTVFIRANDFEGNFGEKYFNFIIDSTRPEISLNSPQNDSLIPDGIYLNFSIVDSNLANVNYSINGGSEIALLYPHNLSTNGWSDGNYIIQIDAIDLAGNSNSSWYAFEIDSNKPTIYLITPNNNSIIKGDEYLNFSIFDSNLEEVNYWINNGVSIPLAEPYDISVADRLDGDYSIQIQAMDLLGRIESKEFFFTIDSTEPEIILNAPLNNSIISFIETVDFSVVDLNLNQVTYAVNIQAETILWEPYDINAAAWADDEYIIQVNAQDLAGNSNSSWYNITIDSTSPVIAFEDRLNHSLIQPGTLLEVSISDLHLNNAYYSLNGGGSMDLPPPYSIDTASWLDGSYIIEVRAMDSAQNEAVVWFEITIDSTPPYVVTPYPLNSGTDVETNTTVVITFSEPMNEQDVENFLTILPSDGYEISWNENGTILYISSKTLNLKTGISYNITLDSQVTDIVGNPMGSDFVLSFTTKDAPSKSSDDNGGGDNNKTEDGEPQENDWLWLFLVFTVIVAVILFLVSMGKKRKKSTEEQSSTPERSISKEGIPEEKEGINSTKSIPPSPPKSGELPPPPKKV